jgi:hypothetical protein
VSRRQGVPWAATSVPEIRRQWCNALDQTVDRFSQGLAPGAVGAGNRRLERMQAKLATEMEIMKAENNALRGAELFWVARDMVDVSMDAASTLPEWTPALVTPSPSGLLCWAKPAGTVPNGPKPSSTTDVPWDAVWWWTRPDGMLQLVPSSRFTKQPELIAPYEVTTPLWAAHTIVINPKQPRTEAAHPFVSVVGAAWLLMGQPGITETRSISDTLTTRPPAADAGPDIAPTPTVTIIELRRPVRLPHDTPGGTSDRQFSRRWWVGGHWRQQACGPNHSERRPKWIAPYIKGPQDKPLTAERVNVWRR